MDQPAVVMAGWRLPGLDGSYLAQRLREKLSGVTLIALTGDGQPEERAQAKEVGFRCHRVKLAALDELPDIRVRGAKRKQVAPSC